MDKAEAFAQIPKLNVRPKPVIKLTAQPLLKFGKGAEDCPDEPLPTLAEMLAHFELGKLNQ